MLNVYQRNCVCRYAFATSGEAKTLCGGGLDGDTIHRNLHYICKAGLHLRNVRIEFGLFATDCSIDIAHTEAVLAEQSYHLRQETLAVNTLVLWVVIREMVAYVAETCRTKQRIADGVDKHIGVTVPQEAEASLNLDAAEPKLTVGHYTMDVISQAYAH